MATVSAAASPHLAHNDYARMDAKTDGQPAAFVLLQAGIQCPHSFENPDPGPHGSVGIIFMAERLTYPAEGLNGGEAGALGEVLIDGAPTDVRADHVLTKGQTITLRTPGGGGFEDPAGREDDRHAADRRAGYA